MKVSTLDHIRCPVCHCRLDIDGETILANGEIAEGLLLCARGHKYPVTAQIAQLLSPDLISDTATSPDIAAKINERVFHDLNAPKHDTNFPIDDSHIYSWLNYYQLFEILPFFQKLQPKSILVAMCGSGLEFDIWRRLATNVWGTDISIGSLQNAKNRAQELGLLGDVVCGDVENIPFVDGSFDLVVVHHGLHHLSSLSTSVAELIRVSHKWCLICEPVDGFARRCLSSVGLSPKIEPGGTVVHDVHENELKSIAARMSVKLESKKMLYPRMRSPHPTTAHALMDSMGLPKLLHYPLKGFNIILGEFIGTKGTFILSKDRTE